MRYRYRGHHDTRGHVVLAPGHVYDVAKAIRGDRIEATISARFSDIIVSYSYRDFEMLWEPVDGR